MMSDFEEHPYWRPPHAPKISTLLPIIKKCNAAIRQFASNPANAEFIQGATEEYREYFITEFNKTGSRGAKYLTLKQIRKRQNIRNAMDDVFGKQLVVDSLQMKFDVNLAKNVSATIGKRLICEAGTYRDHESKPARYHFKYLNSNCIENYVNQLFQDVNQPIEPGRDDWYNVATDFFNKFLFAHPFENGNDRVARILLSALLINYTTVPLCLFLWNSDYRQIYLDVLAEAHDPMKKNDKLLKSFIIEGVYGAVEHCVKSLEIEVDLKNSEMQVD